MAPNSNSFFVFEEKIIELQATKSKLYRDLFGEGEFASGLTKENLLYLFSKASVI